MLLPNKLFKRLLSSSATTHNTIQTRPAPSKAHLAVTPPSTSLPKGYIVGATHCGIKKSKATPPKLDLGLIVSTSPYPTSAAASFTRNAFRAAPVLVSDEVVRKRGGYARGVIVNSGCANAVTGSKGMEDAWSMVREGGKVVAEFTKNSKASKLGGEDPDVLVMSTGVIGVNLPMSKILDGIRSFTSTKSSTLSDTPSSWIDLAHAFMTTDTFPKLRTRTFKIREQEYRLAGIDKGAGMIHPDMGPASTSFALSAETSSRQLHATLLGCIVTDAPIGRLTISVDGDMSTNDTVILLANGAAHAEAMGALKDAEEPTPIDQEVDPDAYTTFRDELTSFAQELAQLVVRDGEGATKFVQVTVKGAPTYASAHAIASRISTSALVKTALYGEDANWGRILAATGSVPLSSPSSLDSPTTVTTEHPKIDPSKVSVTFLPSSTLSDQSPLTVLLKGEPHPFSEARAKEILKEEEFEVVVDLGLGGGKGEEARYWTCDLSYLDCLEKTAFTQFVVYLHTLEYVRINGDYRS
ncbi:arginine biosynthesis protein ArgJ [Crepidotus variabilis]|uniref:Arginine biosynthesis bifunctional protein ArgJ, mitochondrial n=1 Tax=Crepidotus variabilis TaxID=179855 RepID=A0A9P6JRH9_9AGAR|nr:arginine biosynthesis protein ArgJ [Crepidotus variabilis]